MCGRDREQVSVGDLLVPEQTLEVERLAYRGPKPLDPETRRTLEKGIVPPAVDLLVSERRLDI